MCADVGQILSAVSEWGTFALSWVSGVAAVASGVVAYRVYRSQTSPDVIVYVDSDTRGSMMAALFVENIGSAPAFDVALSVSGDVAVGAEQGKETVSSFLSREVAMLPPGSRRGVYLGTFPSILSVAGVPTFDVTVRYSSRRGGTPSEASFPIELESFRECLVARTPVDRNLERIADGVEKIGKAMRRS